MNKEIEFRVRQALFDDDGVANSLESLAGTLKAAKRQDVEQMQDKKDLELIL